MRRFLLLGLVGVVWAAVPACGSDPGAPDDGGADATADVAKKKDAADDSPFGQDVATFDAFPPPDPAVDGGGPFLCEGCVCNGADHFCYVISGGGKAPAPMPLDFDAGDAGLCPEPDAGSSACHGIPPDCLPNPTCACIMKHFSATSCQVDPSGSGIILNLMAP